MSTYYILYASHVHAQCLRILHVYNNNIIIRNILCYIRERRSGLNEIHIIIMRSRDQEYRRCTHDDIIILFSTCIVKKIIYAQHASSKRY